MKKLIAPTLALLVAAGCNGGNSDQAQTPVTHHKKAPVSTGDPHADEMRKALTAGIEGKG